MITSTQKCTCKAIVRCFETSSPRGRYDAVSVLKGDTGGLSYGINQATRASGSLHLLILSYVKSQGKYSEPLSLYLPALASKSPTLDGDPAFKKLLKLAGQEDPIMGKCQEQFFELRYWAPAAHICEELGLTLPLSYAVIYDSTVHGSRDYIVAKTNTYAGRVRDHGERVWISTYVDKRNAWLYNTPRLRRTVYRMQAFRTMIGISNWNLDLPVTVKLNGGQLKLKMEDLPQ